MINIVLYNVVNILPMLLPNLQFEDANQDS